MVASVGKLSYNQLVEKIIDYKHSADSSRVSEGNTHNQTPNSDSNHHNQMSNLMSDSEFSNSQCVSMHRSLLVTSDQDFWCMAHRFCVVTEDAASMYDTEAVERVSYMWQFLLKLCIKPCVIFRETRDWWQTRPRFLQNHVIVSVWDFAYRWRISRPEPVVGVVDWLVCKNSESLTVC